MCCTLQQCSSLSFTIICSVFFSSSNYLLWLRLRFTLLRLHYQFYSLSATVGTSYSWYLMRLNPSENQYKREFSRKRQKSGVEMILLNFAWKLLLLNVSQIFLWPKKRVSCKRWSHEQKCVRFDLHRYANDVFDYNSNDPMRQLELPSNYEWTRTIFAFYQHLGDFVCRTLCRRKRREYEKWKRHRNFVAKWFYQSVRIVAFISSFFFFECCCYALEILNRDEEYFVRNLIYKLHVLATIRAQFLKHNFLLHFKCNEPKKKKINISAQLIGTVIDRSSLAVGTDDR